jgi:acyl dehydratase
VYQSAAAYALVLIAYLQVEKVDREHVLERAAAALAPQVTLFMVGHALRNLAEGVGGPRDPAVLWDPEEIAAEVRAGGLRVERCEEALPPLEGEAQERRRTRRLGQGSTPPTWPLLESASPGRAVPFERLASADGRRARYSVARIRIEEDAEGRTVYRLRSHRRTITETDIVSFVNLIGLHEPPFIDMEWIEKKMPGIHNKRFAPAPFLISLGMGLVATHVIEITDAIVRKEDLGPFHGMVGIEARVKGPAFPGDTLQVDLEAGVDRRTSKGQTLVYLQHDLRNQRDQTVVIFTEKIIFDPPA